MAAKVSTIPCNRVAISSRHVISTHYSYILWIFFGKYLEVTPRNGNFVTYIHTSTLAKFNYNNITE